MNNTEILRMNYLNKTLIMRNTHYFFLRTLIATSLLHQALTSTSAVQCPDTSLKWRDFGGDICYIIVENQAVQWTDAVYNCFVEGGSLASFHSIEDMRNVIGNITDRNAELYIGLWKQYDGSLEWVDKTAIDFRNWDRGEPNFDSEKCVEIYSENGKWNDIDCHAERGYICSAPKKPISQFTRVPRKVCPDNFPAWHDYDGEFCYIIEKAKKKSWQTALRLCNIAGGSLASFHSIDEISSVLQNYKGTDEWLYIGLRQNEYGYHKWADRSPFDFDYWKLGIPNNAEEKCVEMSTKTGHWRGVNCEKVSGYICSAVKDICGRNIVSDSGYIQSPQFPGDYRPNEDCTWNITVPEGYQVALQIYVLDLEFDYLCQKDFLKIFDGHESNSPVLDTLCGYIPSTIMHSTKNKMSIKFVTDSSEQSRGFMGQFVKGLYQTENINGSEGEIRIPMHGDTYGPGEKFLWKITVPENYRVHLKFLTFDVQGDGTRCVFDFVEVRDGDDDSSPVLAKLCGSDIPDDIVSSGNSMSVLFVSDLMVEKAGFTAAYAKNICGENIISDEGVLSSPNYPQSYGRNQHCEWKITVPENHRVALQFQAFNMEHGNCALDFVEIRDGHEGNSSVLGKFCGEEVPETIRSSNNEISVILVSDNSIQHQGFQARFTKAKFCGGDVAADTGILMTPNYPQNYGPGEECVWRIMVPVERRVSLKFRTFQVEHSKNCVGDFLEIRDGNETTSPLLSKVCGSSLPADDVISSSNEMTVVFASDISGENTGFLAEFKGTCGREFIGDSGSFWTPRYPRNYGADEECVWKITVPDKYRVVLKFHTFEVERSYSCKFDFVEIRDGHESNSTVLGKLCGNVVPGAIRSAGNKMSVIFSSDSSTEKQGFTASFKKETIPLELLENSVFKDENILVQDITG